MLRGCAPHAARAVVGHLPDEPTEAGEPGFEPEIEDPKSPVIPFHHSPLVAHPHNDCTDGLGDPSSSFERDEITGPSLSAASAKLGERDRLAARPADPAVERALDDHGTHLVVARAPKQPHDVRLRRACSRHAPRPQKRHAPSAALSQVQQSTLHPRQRGLSAVRVIRAATMECTRRGKDRCSRLSDRQHLRRERALSCVRQTISSLS